MRIGIFSDTHDNILKIQSAVRFFKKNKVDFVFHAGDFIAPFTIPKIQALTCEWRGVFGNNDGEKYGLAKISGGRIQDSPLVTRLVKRRIIIVHDLNTLNPRLKKADLIIFGHTHKAEIIKRDNQTLINPGECGGWLTQRSTVAIVELDTLTGKIYTI